jgi:hypothetical protein
MQLISIGDNVIDKKEHNAILYILKFKTTGLGHSRISIIDMFLNKNQSIFNLKKN